MKNKIYFLGIGGIGMSAIALYFRQEGYMISGYDRTPSDITHQFETGSSKVSYEDSIDSIPKEFLDPLTTLVIYTPAIPKDNLIMNYFKDNGFELKKRSAILGLLTAGDKYLYAVAGTHGKTSITTMLGYLLNEVFGGSNAFLGGISKNYNTNYLLSTTSNVVVEADEFDRSFLQLYPNLAIITSMDADHLDIYGTKEEIEKAFIQFATQVKEEGIIIIKKGLEEKLYASNDKLSKNISIYTYSLDSKDSNFFATYELCANGFYKYSLFFRDLNNTSKEALEVLKVDKLGIPGLLNLENSIAALAACFLTNQNIDKNLLNEKLGGYQGVKRRFDVLYSSKNRIYIDDYAHHPEEISKTISAIRNMYPGKKIMGIFQPHLFSRTRDFAEGFASSLSKLDGVILLDIYPARELPIEGVTSNIIFKDIDIANKHLLSKDEALLLIKSEYYDVLLTIGAGDIAYICVDIVNILLESDRK